MRSAARPVAALSARYARAPAGDYRYRPIMPHQTASQTRTESTEKPSSVTVRRRTAECGQVTVLCGCTSAVAVRDLKPRGAAPLLLWLSWPNRPMNIRVVGLTILGVPVAVRPVARSWRRRIREASATARFTADPNPRPLPRHHSFALASTGLADGAVPRVAHRSPLPRAAADLTLDPSLGRSGFRRILRLPPSALTVTAPAVLLTWRRHVPLLLLGHRNSLHLIA
jgi:hypothetical protein